MNVKLRSSREKGSLSAGTQTAFPATWDFVLRDNRVHPPTRKHTIPAYQSTHESNDNKPIHLTYPSVSLSSPSRVLRGAGRVAGRGAGKEMYGIPTFFFLSRKKKPPAAPLHTRTEGRLFPLSFLRERDFGERSTRSRGTRGLCPV